MTNSEFSPDGSDPRLVISGCGLISAIGMGFDTFTDSFWKRRSGRSKLEGDELPLDEACDIPDFTAATALGPKGTRNMDRTTALAVKAAELAIRDSKLDVEAHRNRIGVVLGTSTGSIRSAHEFTEQSMVQLLPYLVNPGVFPSTILNCAASQCAIWHKLKGVNATISGGALSGVLALRYAAICLRRGYADALLTGAVEEFSLSSAWGYRLTSSAESLRHRPPGEGCAFFVLERHTTDRSQKRILGELLATETGVFALSDNSSAEPQARGLAACIHKCLCRAGVNPADILAVSKRGNAGYLRQVEDAALKAALGEHTPRYQFAIADLTGECFSASSAFQTAALLALFERAGSDGASCGLITTLGRGGAVACSLIRKRGS